MISCVGYSTRGDGMFTKVRLQNFRSFGDITLDLSGKNGNPKNLAVIFGENGAGKSNLTSAFVLLREILSTMNVRDMYEELLNQKAIFTDENMESIMREKIKSGMRDIQAIIDDCRMVGCDDPVVAEYDFQIFGNAGRYTIQLGKDEIIYEKLEYLLNKRRGIYFECAESGININSAIVKDKDLLGDIKATAKRFWGKHSILAIITHELNDKSKTYGRDNISDNFDDVLAELSVLSCYIGIGTRRWDKLYAPLDILESADIGNLPVEKEKELDIAERIFTKFFTSINSDILRVYYHRTYNDKYVRYELLFEKMVSGKYRHIEFARESTGNHQILRVLCYLLTACLGGIVVIDEADSGVHDYLFKKVFDEISTCISGQVIMTTHNTMLMEADFARDATYILSEEPEGHKTIKAISDYDKRTYFNNNVRNKYMNNEYGGLPNVEPLDFEPLIQEISDSIV